MSGALEQTADCHQATRLYFHTLQAKRQNPLNYHNAIIAAILFLGAVLSVKGGLAEPFFSCTALRAVTIVHLNPIQLEFVVPPLRSAMRRALVMSQGPARPRG